MTQQLQMELPRPNSFVVVERAALVARSASLAASKRWDEAQRLDELLAAAELDARPITMRRTDAERWNLL